MGSLRLLNARIVDGTGAPARPGSVLVRDDVIAEVGANPEARAGDGDSGAGCADHRTLDVRGQVVCPGFIDVHTHADFALSAAPRAWPMLRQGVTTLVVGNCGFSPFPLAAGTSGLLAEAAGFLDDGVPWGAWDDAAGFVRHLEALPLGPNVGFLVGHGAVRIAAMGFARRAPTRTEIATMQVLVAEAMQAGALGLSTGLIYAPGSAAESDELERLARVVGRFGGFYASHLRSEGAALLEAVDEALTVGTTARVPVQLSHLKALGAENEHQLAPVLARIDRAAVAGLDVLADQYPYTATSTSLSVVLPPWALEGGADAARARMADPVVRQHVRATIVAQDPAALRAGLRAFQPDQVVVADAPGELAAYRGLDLVAVARARGQEPVDAALDLFLAGGSAVTTVTHAMSESGIAAVMRDPRVMVASDGWTLRTEPRGTPHPRSAGTFARVLGRYVRERAVLGLEEAVRRMTSLPARRLGAAGAGRGVLRPGAAADLVVFDPDRVRDQATFTAPGRGPVGISHVVVGGRLAVEDGQDTGVRAGRVLRGRHARARS